MDMPPTRYKVVQRGRRLRVVDTWREGQDTAPRPGPVPPRDMEGPRDSSTFVTRRWYDNKAPRVIPLNYATRTQINNLRFAIALAVAVLVGVFVLLWPVSLILLIALVVFPQTGRSLREASTRLIDLLDQTVAGS